MKNFINNLRHKGTKIKSNIKTLNEKLNSITESEIVEMKHNPTIKEMLIGWLLDVAVYGFIITFIQMVYIGIKLPMIVPYMFANGMAWWMFKQLIHIIKTPSDK